MNNPEAPLASHLKALSHEVERLGRMPDAQREIPEQWKDLRAALASLLFSYIDLAPPGDRLNGPFFEEAHSALREAMALVPPAQQTEIVRESLQRFIDLLSSQTFEEMMQHIQEACEQHVQKH